MMIDSMIVERLHRLACLFLRAEEEGWAGIVQAAARRIEGVPAVIQDRHGLLDSMPETRDALLDWIADPSPKLEGLRFRVREVWESFHPHHLVIELIVETPGGLMLKGFALDHWYSPWDSIANDNAAKQAHRARIFRHALDEAHHKLVEQLRVRGKESWPKRPVRIVRYQSSPGDVPS